MLHVRTFDARYWEPDDPLFRGRTAWFAGEVCLTDGIEQIVLDGSRAAFGCETCLTWDCSDRRGARIGRLGADVLLTQRGERVPYVLEKYGAVLVEGGVWARLAATFPNLAGPIPPATRGQALEGWLSALPQPRWGALLSAGALRERVLAGGRLEWPEVDALIDDALRWARAAPDAPVEMLVDPEPEPYSLDGEEWTGVAIGDEGEWGLWMEGWAVGME